MQEEADAQVAALLPQHLRDKLQLIVIYPHGRAGGRLLGRCPREAPVDPDVGIPPWPPELRRGDHIVIERPERAVAEALVVVADLIG